MRNELLWFGQPATDGAGPERYAVRIPLWLPNTVKFLDTENLAVGESKPIQIAGRSATEINRGGMGQRIAGFVLRAFHFESDSKEGQALKKEVNGILKKRGALAHGGNFLEPPMADENERLRAIVAAALDLKLAK